MSMNIIKYDNFVVSGFLDMFISTQFSKLNDHLMLLMIYNFKNKGYYPQLLNRMLYFIIKHAVV